MLRGNAHETMYLYIISNVIQSNFQMCHYMAPGASKINPNKSIRKTNPFKPFHMTPEELYLVNSFLLKHYLTRTSHNSDTMYWTVVKQM